MDDRAAYRQLAVIGAIVCAGIVLPYAAGLHGAPPFILDRHQIQIGLDFLNTWFYGQAFWTPDPGRFYDQAVYEAAIQAIFPANRFDHLWSYPPPFLILAAPFGLLPYLPALALWTGLGLGTLFLSVRATGRPWRSATILLSPAVLQGVTAGQISMFCASVFIWAFRFLDRRPCSAGLLISLLSLKPQTAFLFPVLLLASKRWRVFWAAAAGTAMIIAVSIVLNGLDPWIAFVAKGLPAQAADMQASMKALFQVSVAPKTGLMLMGLPAPAATLVQGVLTLLAASLTAYAAIHRRIAGPEREALIFLACSAFATPYLLSHDLAALSAGAVLFLPQDGGRKPKAWLALVLYMPSIQIALAGWNIHAAFLIPIGLALWQSAVLRREVRATRSACPEPVVPEGLRFMASRLRAAPGRGR